MNAPRLSLSAWDFIANSGAPANCGEWVGTGFMLVRLDRLPIETLGTLDPRNHARIALPERFEEYMETTGRTYMRLTERKSETQRVVAYEGAGKVAWFSSKLAVAIGLNDLFVRELNPGRGSYVALDSLSRPSVIWAGCTPPEGT